MILKINEIVIGKAISKQCLTSKLLFKINEKLISELSAGIGIVGIHGISKIAG